LIRIVIYQAKNGLVEGFEVSGHSGFGPYGSDIVCAGVSALTQTAIKSLKQLAGASPDLKIKEGFMACHLPEGGGGSQAQLLVEAMVLGLKDIAESYPGNIAITIVRRR